MDSQQSLAFLFTDIEGSSQLWEQHSGSFLKALELHDRLLTELCAQFGGRVVKNEGDAFFCVFPQPLAAAQFALQAQQQLQEQDWGQFIPEPLRVRMGLHYGAAHARGDDYFGTEINRTARICDAGHGGQILVSEELLSACGELDHSVVITDLARHRLRGLSEPQRLYQLTLRDWPQQEWPVLRTLDHVPHNLPAQTTSFVGRERDLERVAALLVDPQVRLITLTGPGGSGKSRLAQEAAAGALERFVDGVFWVSLAEFSAVEAVPAAIMEVLKLQPQAGQSPAAVIAAHARDRQLLLVLDNFEHLIEAADFLAELLRLSVDVRLLVTSREVLHLQGEQLFHVAPLGLPEPPINYQTLSQYESVHLFLYRARAVSDDFAITEDNAAAIAEICLRLDGIPLAIELAAAWVRVYPPLRILQRLGGRSPFLTSRIRGVAERQRTVADTINWSYQMLSAEEQRVLRWLSVFRGGFFLDAAEAVCGETAIENVMTLCDKSLLYSKEILGQQRFYMLETIREFAEERLLEASEEDEAHKSHWTYHTQWWGSLGNGEESLWDASHWALVALEAPNAEEAVRQAARQGCMVEAGPLFTFLHAELDVSSSAAERLLPVLDEVLTQVAGHEGGGWPASAAEVRLACHFHAGRFVEGLGHAEEALALAEASEQHQSCYGTAFWASALALHVGRQEGLRWTREMGKWLRNPVERANLACHLSSLGDPAGAISEADRALAESEGTPDPWSRYMTLANSIEADLMAGQLAKALPYIPELVRLARGPLAGDPKTVQFGWTNAITVLARSGETEEATRLARGQAVLIDTLEPGLRALYLVSFLTKCIWGRLWTLAAELADQYLGPWPVADLPAHFVAVAGGTIAQVNARRGNCEQAVAASAPFLESEWRFDEEGDSLGGQTLKSVGEVLRGCGRLSEAVQVTVVALRLQSLWPLKKLLCEELLELLAGEMPAEVFAQARSVGETMTGAEAFALARKTLLGGA